MMYNDEYHHDISQFYLKAFLDANGGYFIYDKLTGRISRAGKGKTFGEINKNFISLNGQQSRTLENMYCYLEGKVANAMVKIRNAEEWSYQDLAYFVAFVNFTLWRVPKYESVVNQKFSTSKRDGFRNIKRKEDRDLLLQANEEDQLKLFKFLAPLTGLSEIPRVGGGIYHNLKQISGHAIAISDMPAVFMKLPSNNYILDEVWIIPVSSNQFFISSPYGRSNFNVDMLKQLNLLLLDQAQRYFAMLNKNWLKETVATYNSMKNENPLVFARVHQDLFRNITGNAELVTDYELMFK